MSIFDSANKPNLNQKVIKEASNSDNMGNKNGFKNLNMQPKHLINTQKDPATLKTPVKQITLE